MNFTTGYETNVLRTFRFNLRIMPEQKKVRPKLNTEYAQTHKHKIALRGQTNLQASGVILLPLVPRALDNPTMRYP